MHWLPFGGTRSERLFPTSGVDVHREETLPTRYHYRTTLNDFSTTKASAVKMDGLESDLPANLTSMSLSTAID